MCFGQSKLGLAKSGQPLEMAYRSDEICFTLSLRDQRAIGFANLGCELKRHADGVAGSKDEIEIFRHLPAREGGFKIAAPQWRGLVLHHGGADSTIVEHLQNVLPSEATLPC